MEKLKMLQEVASHFLRRTYGMELSVPIKINRKLKKTLGRFTRKNGRPQAIELSADLVQYQDFEVIVDVLKHELIHYACFVRGKPFKDGDADFERELEKHGVGRTRTYAYKGKLHVFRCTACGKEYLRHKKYFYFHDDQGFVKFYRCGQCHGRLKYAGTQLRT